MFENLGQTERLNVQHQQNLIRQAEQHRLSQSVTSMRRPRIIGFYRPALARLGAALTDMGMNLQQRYGELTEIREIVYTSQTATDPDCRPGMVC